MKPNRYNSSRDATDARIRAEHGKPSKRRATDSGNPRLLIAFRILLIAVAVAAVLSCGGII